MFDSNRISSSRGAIRCTILLHCKLITSNAADTGDGIVTYANVCCKLNPSWTGTEEKSLTKNLNSWMAMHGFTQSFHQWLRRGSPFHLKFYAYLLRNVTIWPIVAGGQDFAILRLSLQFSPILVGHEWVSTAYCFIQFRNKYILLCMTYV